MEGKRFFGWMIVTLLTVLGAYGQSPQPTDTVWRSEQLQEVSVSSKVGRVKTKYEAKEVKTTNTKSTESKQR